MILLHTILHTHMNTFFFLVCRECQKLREHKSPHRRNTLLAKYAHRHTLYHIAQDIHGAMTHL